MAIIKLLRDEMRGSTLSFLTFSGLGGLSNLGLIASINTQAGALFGQQNLWVVGVFLTSLVLFAITHYYICNIAAEKVTAVIHQLRLRLLDAVRESELSSIDSVGRSRIISAAVQDAATLAQAASVVVFSIQSLLLIIFVGMYVAYLSPVVFALATLIIGGAGIVFFVRGAHIKSMEQEASRSTTYLLDQVSDLLGGFKEVKLNRLRNDQLFDDISRTSKLNAIKHKRVEVENFKRVTFSQISLFTLLAATVFLAPLLSQPSNPAITNITMALLFIIGSAFGLLQYVPIWISADTAAQSIMNLAEELKKSSPADGSGNHRRPKEQFATIEFQDVIYRYNDETPAEAFQIGPLNFTLRSGELVIIVGGNGSGKSTFLKLLSGLYIPQSGAIRLDGVPVCEATRDAYRNLMASVFSDYYLFKRLYGIRALDFNEANRLLSALGMERKTRLTDNAFDTIDLSDGQRKRLALLVALLEKRPLLLLDEWASNQDAQFRRRFYNDLLPAFKKSGMTLVVITHDDQYLNELDLPYRKLRMRDGCFTDLAD